MNSLLRMSAVIASAAMFFTAYTESQAGFDPARAKLLDTKKIQLFEKSPEPQSPTALAVSKAALSFTQPPVVGVPAAFTVSFLNSSGSPLPRFILNSDLLFELPSGVRVSIVTKGKSFSGAGKILIPFRDAQYRDGVFSGTMTFDSTAKDISLNIALRKTTRSTDLALCEAKISVGYGKIAGTFFGWSGAPVAAGQDIDIPVTLYNHRGEIIQDAPEVPVMLTVASDSPCSIGGRPAGNTAQIEPQAFVRGTAVIKLRREKAGIVRLSVPYGQRFERKGTGSWNGAEVTVVPAAAESVSIKAADAAFAGSVISCEWTAFDRFGNTADAASADAVLSPFPADCVMVKGEPLKAASFRLGKGVSEIVITKAGEYSLSSLKNVQKIKILPAEPVRTDAAVPETAAAGADVAIKVTACDRYGNTAEVKSPLVLKSDLFPGGKKEITLSGFSPAEIRLRAEKAGSYPIVFSGLGEPLKKKITVSPAAIKPRLDESGITRSRGDYVIRVPFLAADEFGNALDAPVSYLLKAEVAGKGGLTVSGKGVSILKKSAEGDRLSLTLKITGGRGFSGTVLSISPWATDFVDVRFDAQKVSIPVNQPRRPATTVRRTGGDGKVEVTAAAAPKDESEQLAMMVSLLRQNPAVREVSLVWEDNVRGSVLRSELVYYRDFSRLDYQKWDLTGKKRVERRLIRKSAEEDILRAAGEGRGKFPGETEVY